MSAQPLFTPIRMGNLHLPNRIVMAPLTRMRAGSIDHVPSRLQADYYAQRASAGLIVAEATAISPEGFGWADTPRSRRSIGRPSTRLGREAIPTTQHLSPLRAEPRTVMETTMPKTTPEQNKAIVLEAFDTLFNKRDYAAAKRFWSDRYIQHSAHIAPGRDGLFDLIQSAPETLRYENQLIVAEGDYVIAHGRFSGNGRPAAWIAADVVRFEDGKLAEHWDVLQDEATRAQSVSGLPMFGERFPD
jgi:predicted SnoaL-like aldol condensation-catalyzing enzyme